jgi:hypothetical protein
MIPFIALLVKTPTRAIIAKAAQVAKVHGGVIIATLGARWVDI